MDTIKTTAGEIPLREESHGYGYGSRIGGYYTTICRNY
jgi:hypothetical protein